MNKCSKKRNSYNIAVVQQLSERYGVTKHYVRMCLNGTRKCITADTLIKEYGRLTKEVEKALNSDPK